MCIVSLSDRIYASLTLLLFLHDSVGVCVCAGSRHRVEVIFFILLYFPGEVCHGRRMW